MEYAHQIKAINALDATHSRIWEINGIENKESKIIIFESYGCKDGTSDVFRIRSPSQKFSWDGRSWNKITVQLHEDGTCDLDVLLPNRDIAKREWGIWNGPRLIKSCFDYKCEHGVLLNDLTFEMDKLD